jgi:hypothetical protein
MTRRRRRLIGAPRLLDAGPSPVCIQIEHTPVSARNSGECRHRAHPWAAGAMHRRLLVLDAQLAERERPASGTAADPQHGHPENL